MALNFEIKDKNEGGQSVRPFAVCTGSDGENAHIEIPQVFRGLPVTSVASHAFADRKDLKSITIPDSVSHIGSYAFYNCTSLETLSLTDSVEEYEGGAIRQCTSLGVIEIHAHRGSYRILKDILADSGAELHVHLWQPVGEEKSGRRQTADNGMEQDAVTKQNGSLERAPGLEVDLIFPAYYDEFREDTHARDFHYHIVGAGLGYREIVTRRAIDLIDYDRKFTTVTSLPGAELTAARIAYGRLAWPLRLLPRHRQTYLAYLKMHSRDLLSYYTARHDVETCARLMEFFRQENASAPVPAGSAGSGASFDLGDL